MPRSSYSDVLERIQAAIEAAKQVFSRFTHGEIAAEYKAGHDPVTDADREFDAVLRKNLLRDGEGWLSYESADNHSGLTGSRLGAVAPLDGTPDLSAGSPASWFSTA